MYLNERVEISNETLSFLGKEFEVLIDSHGPDHVTGLMQKVISALEQLEHLAAEKENENQVVDNLKTTITRWCFSHKKVFLIVQCHGVFSDWSSRM